MKEVIYRMKREWRIAFAITLVFVAVQRPMATTASTQTSLTDAERKYVREHLPRALFWFAQWSRPRACERKAAINLQDMLGDYEGKEVRVQLEASEANIYATIDEFKHRITIRRNKTFPYVAGMETFCEDTYAAFAKNEERRAREEANRTGRLPTTSTQRERETRDLMLKSGIGKTLASDVVAYREEMSLLIPEKWSFIPLIDAPTTTPTKKALYDGILRAAATDPDFNCEKGQTADLWIPEFDERDPGVYVRTQERPGRHTIAGVSIVFFRFGKQATTGLPLVQAVTRYFLEDEIYYYAGRIADATYKVEKVACAKP